jgi:hypothetical protein
MSAASCYIYYTGIQVLRSWQKNDTKLNMLSAINCYQKGTITWMRLQLTCSLIYSFLFAGGSESVVVKTNESSMRRDITMGVDSFWAVAVIVKSVIAD